MVGRGTAGVCRADDARFAQLYDRCYESIWQYCRRRVAVDAVDDVVADTFLTVWRRLDEVPAGDEELLWIYGVAYRMIGHLWRSAARRHRLLVRLRTVDSRATWADDDDVMVGGDQHRGVLAALGRLGDADAEMLRLVAWERLAVVDVAAVLGITPDTARQRLLRARRRLAREYERLQSEPPSGPAAPRGGVG
jgi:RNA polymerase sigma-70 factor (ECF subfamily)